MKGLTIAFKSQIFETCCVHGACHSWENILKGDCSQKIVPQNYNKNSHINEINNINDSILLT
jgi:hypothetical protein